MLNGNLCISRALSVGNLSNIEFQKYEATLLIKEMIKVGALNFTHSWSMPIGIWG